ncbi:hypothetical protein NPIL_13261 [Nephila pilipes]|uniref:Uncharacterized protein n=1 Tax=Nephila pilipes TaxID=299642 RepID=A0A8X6P5J3_NEPPI|nr:hypothetical protein NPIL_13261 [Nephila pilipes]
MMGLGFHLNFALKAFTLYVVKPLTYKDEFISSVEFDDSNSSRAVSGGHHEVNNLGLIHSITETVALLFPVHFKEKGPFVIKLTESVVQHSRHHEPTIHKANFVRAKGTSRLVTVESTHLSR